MHSQTLMHLILIHTQMPNPSREELRLSAVIPSRTLTHLMLMHAQLPSQSRTQLLLVAVIPLLLQSIYFTRHHLIRLRGASKVTMSAVDPIIFRTLLLSPYSANFYGSGWFLRGMRACHARIAKTPVVALRWLTTFVFHGCSPHNYPFSARLEPADLLMVVSQADSCVFELIITSFFVTDSDLPTHRASDIHKLVRISFVNVEFESVTTFKRICCALPTVTKLEFDTVAFVKPCTIEDRHFLWPPCATVLSLYPCNWGYLDACAIESERAAHVYEINVAFTCTAPIVKFCPLLSACIELHTLRICMYPPSRSESLRGM